MSRQAKALPATLPAQLKAERAKHLTACETALHMVDELRAIIRALEAIAESNNDVISTDLAIVGWRIADDHFGHMQLLIDKIEAGDKKRA